LIPESLSARTIGQVYVVRRDGAAGPLAVHLGGQTPLKEFAVEMGCVLWMMDTNFDILVCWRDSEAGVRYEGHAGGYEGVAENEDGNHDIARILNSVGVLSWYPLPL
jgi:hypothetical protein